MGEEISIGVVFGKPLYVMLSDEAETKVTLVAGYPFTVADVELSN